MRLITDLIDSSANVEALRAALAWLKVARNRRGDDQGQRDNEAMHVMLDTVLLLERSA